MLISPRIKIISLIFIALITYGLNSKFSAQTFRGNDDYMRMARVKELLTAPHEYQPYLLTRMGIPGEPVYYHWSPMFDHVLAGLVFPLAKIIPLNDALYSLGMLLPLILLIGWFMSLYWAISRYQRLGTDLGFWTLLFTLPFMYPALRQFSAGVIDHHSVQIIFITIIYGSFLGIFRGRTSAIFPLIAGVLTVLSMILSVETLPWILGLNVLLGMIWLSDRTAYQTAPLAYGTSILISSAALGLANIPWSTPFQDACDAYSTAFLGLGGVAGCFWIIIRFAPRFIKSRVSLSLLFSAIVGVSLLGPWLYFNYTCLIPTYETAPQELHSLWLDHVSEALPIQLKIKERLFLTSLCFIIVVSAFISSLVASLQKQNRPIWITHSLLLGMALLASFWQFRIMDFGIVFALVPWVFLTIPSFYDWFIHRCPRDIRFAALPMVFITGLYINHHTHTEPPYKSPAAPCDRSDLAAYFESRGDSQAHITAAFIDSGPELLYRTKLHVISAPYHRNVDGIIKTQQALIAESDENARALFEDIKAEKLYLCKSDLAFLDTLAGSQNYFSRRVTQGKPAEWIRLEHRFKDAWLFNLDINNN